MTFQFQAAQSVTDNITRILDERVQNAVEALQDDDKDKGVHSARKDMKRIRAVLRLVRDPIGKKAYRRENAFFRDTARELAGSRDSYVIVKTLDKLVRTHAEHIPTERVEPIRKYLFDAYEAQHQTFDEGNLGEVSKRLKTAQQRIPLLQLDEKGYDALQDGLLRVYSGGRVQMATAKKHATVENFHEWRKNVKYLWHQVELLSPLWEPMLSTYADELHSLADDLGDDHDYAVLRQTLLELPQEVGDGEIIYLLSRLIESERQHLQDAAFRKGARIYAEDTHAFLDRLRIYWDVWARDVNELVVDH